MATNTAGTTARDFHTNQTHYLKKVVNYSDTGAITVGIIPAGSYVLRALASVNTAFNAGSAAISIGTTLSSAAFFSLVSVLTTGTKIDTTIATGSAASINPASDMTVTATLTTSGSAGTAGQAAVIVEYVNL